MTTITKPKVDRTKYIIQDKSNETIIKKIGEIDGSNFKIRKCENSTIYLLDWTKGIFIDDCTNCKIIIGPCDGALFIRTSYNCEISAVCKQLRFRDCRSINIFTYCPSDPVVENSTLINFATFNSFLPNLRQLFISAGFTPKENKFQCVYDFTEKKNINDEMHWSLLGDDEFVIKRIGDDEGKGEESLYDGFEDEMPKVVVVENKEEEIVNKYENEEILNQNENEDLIQNENEEILIYNKNEEILTKNENEEIITQNDKIFTNNDKEEIINCHLDDNDDIIVVDNINLNVLTSHEITSINNQKSSSNDFLFVNQFNPPTQQTNENNENIENNENFIVINNYNLESNSGNHSNKTNTNNISNNTSPITFNLNDETTLSITNFNTNNIEDEETKHIRLRQLEQEGIRKKIILKMEHELREKNNLQVKAREYLDNLYQERIKLKERNKNRNKLDQENYLNDRKLNNINNPWSKVIGMVELKESEYKGSNNVNRMREVMIRRKADYEKK